MATTQDRYTSGEYLRQNPKWHADESPWKAKYMLRMIARNGLAPRRICDVGCGAGEVLRLVHDGLQRKCACWGHDISPQAIEWAQRLSSTGLVDYDVIDATYTREASSLRHVWKDNGRNPRKLARRVTGFVAQPLMSVPGRVFFAIYHDLAARVVGRWKLPVLAR